MKKLFTTLFVVFFAASVMAQPGLSCKDPIPVDKSYDASVNAGDELWYTAWTYDLPIHVYFSPDSMNTQSGPEVQIDFTCDYGDYSHDRKLDSVINILKVLGLSLPVEFMCEEVIRNGKVEWDLSIDQKYRDQLTEYGLTHNVQAFVKVYFPDGGNISLTPDTLFQSCIDHGHYAKLNDTISIAANDSNKMIVLPYSEWKNDSLRIVWTGEKPARVWVAEDECRFTPVDGSVYVKAKYDIDKDNPKKLYPADMQSAIDNWIGAGIFYAKVLSEGPGQLVVERIPLGAIQGDAVLLKHGETVQLQANDNRVFCFPKTWAATEFLANTQYLMDMHVSSTPEFEPGDAVEIAKYPFGLSDNARKLQLTKGDIAHLTASAIDDYLYVRFVCNHATTLTPSLWSISSCVDNTILISLGEEYSIPKSDSRIYRMDYRELADYDLTVKWFDTRGNMPAYVGFYCDFKTTDTNKKSISVRRESSTTVKAATLNSWASSVNEDGFIYLRLPATNDGKIIFTSSRPIEEDPIEPIFTTITDTLCFGKEYDWNGTIYTASGTYEQKFTSLNGADSTVTLNLTILPEVLPTTDEVTVRYDELPYLWNDSAFTESTVYTATLQNKYGCDSVVTLKLTVLEKNDIKTTDDLILNLKSAFKVYTMAHADWVAGDVEVNWQGTTPLHVFIAKEEVYNLTPYNRHVLHYEVVPAGEEWVVTKEQMAAWEAEATAAGGKLYVRFLTEQEGRLTTVPMD